MENLFKLQIQQTPDGGLTASQNLAVQSFKSDSNLDKGTPWPVDEATTLANTFLCKDQSMITKQLDPLNTFSAGICAMFGIDPANVCYVYVNAYCSTQGPGSAPLPIRFRATLPATVDPAIIALLVAAGTALGVANSGVGTAQTQAEVANGAEEQASLNVTAIQALAQDIVNNTVPGSIQDDANEILALCTTALGNLAAAQAASAAVGVATADATTQITTASNDISTVISDLEAGIPYVISKSNALLMTNLNGLPADITIDEVIVPTGQTANLIIIVGTKN